MKTPQESKFVLKSKLSLGLAYLAIPLCILSAHTAHTSNGARGGSIAESQDHKQVGLWLVKMRGPITEAKKAELTEMGFKILRYVPENSFIVRGFGDKLTNLKSVKSFKAYNAKLKISSEVIPMSIYSRDQMVSAVVTGFSAEDLKNVVSSKPDLEWVSLDGRLAVVRMTRLQLDDISNLNEVEYIQEVPQFETMDAKLLDSSNVRNSDPIPLGDYTDLAGVETGTNLMNADSMWNLGIKGSTQKVAVADTGFDSGVMETLHPALFGVVSEGKAFGYGAQNWGDHMGHGSHVAGSVAMRSGSSGGKILGNAFEAQIVAQGLWSPILDNLSVPPKLGTLFSHAMASGAYIHTNSWGNPSKLGVYDSFAQQVDEFQWNNPQFLILFAAGNSGCDADQDGRIDPGSVSSPGTSKNALTVGASEGTTTIGGIQRKVGELNPDSVKKCWNSDLLRESKLSDNANGIAVFSSRGPTKDGRLKPEIVAPGTNILSLQSQVTGASKLWGAYNPLYAFAGGTSMATPLTAGAAALTRQYLIEKMGQSQPSGALVKAMIMQSATDLFPGQYGTDSKTQELTVRPNSDQGFGRVNLAAVSSGRLLIKDHIEGIATNQSFEMPIQVSKEAKSIQVTLVYTDAPSTPTATKNLVNNLDLEVVQNGVVIGKSNSTVNNFEFLSSQLATGDLKVRVIGTSVPMGKSGKLPFALVAELR